MFTAKGSFVTFCSMLMKIRLQIYQRQKQFGFFTSFTKQIRPYVADPYLLGYISINFFCFRTLYDFLKMQSLSISDVRHLLLLFYLPSTESLMISTYSYSFAFTASEFASCSSSFSLFSFSFYFFFCFFSCVLCLVLSTSAHFAAFSFCFFIIPQPVKWGAYLKHWDGAC